MVDACFTDETPWALYLSKGHPCACVFKGMACILNGSKLPMEWKNFKCTTLAIDCCCLQVLFNQPDFMHVPIILKNTCSAGGFRLPDLPKFCCELRSARGMLRGYTTWTPHPPRKINLEKYALAALDSNSLAQMWRFVLLSFKRKRNTPNNAIL